MFVLWTELDDYNRTQCVEGVWINKPSPDILKQKTNVHIPECDVQKVLDGFTSYTSYGVFWLEETKEGWL